MEATQAIPCSIGILTYNSAENLARALESVKGCDEIIIADGGSTDDTLQIARAYGCKIMEQSNPGHPIEDFSLERNRTLDAASHDLFFYLDSDEFASPELIKQIRQITEKTMEPTVYFVQYLRTDPSGKQIYKTFRKSYQPRLFHRSTGAQFQKPVHEKITYSASTPTEQIEAPWYVPVDLHDFKTYKQKIDTRVALQAAASRSRSFVVCLQKAIVQPTIEILKTPVRIIGARIKHGSEAMPAIYELRRIYMYFVQMREFTRQYFCNIWKKEHEEGD